MKRYIALILLTVGLFASSLPFVQEIKLKELEISIFKEQKIDIPICINKNEACFIYDTLLFFGYNKRYITYEIRSELEAEDGYDAKFYIQDLVTDKIVYSATKYNNTLIKQKLKEYKIEPKRVEFIPNKLRYRGDSYSLYATSDSVYVKDFDSHFLNISEIYIKSRKKGKKVINKELYKKQDQILAREPMGFLKLGNNRRAVAVVGKVRRGWEGPPNVLLIQLFGANLKVGFKGTSKNPIHSQHHKLESRQGTHLKD